MTIPARPRRFFASIFLLVAFVLVGLISAIGEQSPSASTASSPPPKIKYEKLKLKNGLDVILYEDHRLPLGAVNIWSPVGPANERTGRTGFAHLFEHMMFE